MGIKMQLQVVFGMTLVTGISLCFGEETVT